MLAVATQENRHEATGEAGNIFPTPALDVEQDHGDIVNEMPVDAVVEIE